MSGGPPLVTLSHAHFVPLSLARAPHPTQPRVSISFCTKNCCPLLLHNHFVLKKKRKKKRPFSFSLSLFHHVSLYFYLFIFNFHNSGGQSKAFFFFFLIIDHFLDSGKKPCLIPSLLFLPERKSRIIL
jgi:hypothetical protein